jgi:dihydroxyacetone kinase-like protein
MSLAGNVDGRLEDENVALDEERKRRLVRGIARSVIERVDELTALDSAIGDGDHGANMKRGFEAVLQDMDALSVMSLPDLLRGVGMKLVAKVGGASGPLFGTLFLALGKDLPDAPSRAAATFGFSAALAAVKARGRSDVGQKTMLDVLEPAFKAFAAGGDAASVREAALLAAEGTVPMRATRGRASFLGERSVGHMDPGARSASLMIGAVCDEFGAR